MVARSLVLSLSAFVLSSLAPLSAQHASPFAGSGNLAVVSTSHEAVSVALPTTSISVTFDRPVSLASLDESSFRVFGRYSGPARGTFQFAQGGKRITFVPDGRFSEIGRAHV